MNINMKYGDMETMKASKVKLEFSSQSADNKSILEQIAYTARVSNPGNQNNIETSEKLVRYLIKHKHWSPFEMVNACLEIETTRDIARQILRHRSFSFQEFCLSGDSEIYFAVPRKLNKGKYTPTQKIKLSELYDKWTNGAKPITDRYGNSRRVSLQNRLKDMHIKIYDEHSGMLSTAHLKEVFQTGVKSLYEITMSDGKKIKSTKEHKFLTPNGFDTLESIVGLEMRDGRALMTNHNSIVGVNGVPCYQSKEWLREKKKESLFLGGGIPWMAETYGINYNTLRKWIARHGLQYSKLEVATTIEPWNKGKYGYTTGSRSVDTREKQRIAALARGENHNWYRGGKSKLRQPLNGTDAKRFRDDNNHTCNRCGHYGGQLDIHHIVPVSVDPSLDHVQSNWELLCRACHIEHHKENDYTGWQNIGAKNKVKNSFIPKWVTITKIDYIGEEQTYDIEIDHDSHNYVANGIIVHNSQRYADPTKDFDFLTREARLQDASNRQNSVEVDDQLLQNEWYRAQQRAIYAAKREYEWAISNGIAKEQARSVLPEGLTASRLYMNGSIRSWIHYIELRSGKETQKEHREVAIACADAIEPIFPMIKEFTQQ
jgi:thymidylate synthase (FAD)